MFGYHEEPNFDLAKEKRRERVGWLFIAGALLTLFFSGDFRAEIGQAYFATVLCYGANFYVAQRGNLGKLWLWKAMFATIPLHVLYLVGLFWSDKMFPNVMTKGVVFIPLLAVGFAIESILINWVVGRFNPSKANQIEGPMTQT